MKLVDRLKEGDVIYTNCIGNHICYHVGIVYSKNGNKRIFHNAPTNKNKYGGTLVSESYENFIKNRIISKVVRTNTKNEDILRVSKKCRDERWDILFFNWEDFVLEVVEGHRRSDIRDGWKIAALGIVLILII